jgi:hypothetical protein
MVFLQSSVCSNFVDNINIPPVATVFHPRRRARLRCRTVLLWVAVFYWLRSEAASISNSAGPNTETESERETERERERKVEKEECGNTEKKRGKYERNRMCRLYCEELDSSWRKDREEKVFQPTTVTYSSTSQLLFYKSWNSRRIYTFLAFCFRLSNFIFIHPPSVSSKKLSSLRYVLLLGRDSSVGIATRYGLCGSEFESRWGTRFSASVQTGPEAHPASCTMGTGSFLGVKRPGYSVDHPPHLAPRLKEEYSYTSTPTLSLRDLF